MPSKSKGAPPTAESQGPQNYYGSYDGHHDQSSSYTRPPPAYGDESPLLGSPRTSEDNIPDDFKYSTSVAEGSIDIRHAFIRKVYSILTAQLLATAVLSSVSFFNASFKSWIQTNTWMIIMAMVGSFAFLFLTYWKRKSYPTNLLFLSAFTAMEAYTIAVVTSFYDSRIVLQAVIITGALFVALTAFAFQTKYDFASWYSYLYGGLWLIIIFGFVSVFFPYNSMVELAYSGVCALLFSAYILFDTQMIMRRMHVEEEIAAAISLYLDIINLFLAILRILNATSDN
ncbi:inhibitor of apoptosis-promoting Bax1-domain-containing protein [Geopyxis carbonaria]|nr:inhibitor of apoptosis-promoting Bax1-domain-containing protein [Geopyxis carbonaria]